MTLTEEERRKIEEEEQARLEAREKLEKKKSGGLGCGGTILLLFGLLLVAGGIASVFMPHSNIPQSTRQHFKASGSFNGTQFSISNLDDLPCQNARIAINIGWTDGGYTLEGYTLEVGQTYTVGAMQFAKSDGTRFDPYAVKPQSLSITCLGTNELHNAIYAGSF